MTNRLGEIVKAMGGTGFNILLEALFQSDSIHLSLWGHGHLATWG